MEVDAVDRHGEAALGVGVAVVVDGDRGHLAGLVRIVEELEAFEDAPRVVADAASNVLEVIQGRGAVSWRATAPSLLT